jgi:peptidoglycan/xylan/chitin deacetylase (PgdA/CDA1 family)
MLRERSSAHATITSVRFVTPILKRIVYPCLANTGYFRSVARPGLAVITYHGVLPQGYAPIDPGFDGNLISADTFRQQLRLLKKKYTVISPEDVRSWCGGELPPRAVLLTCDDGLLNNLTEMLPVLQDEGLRCLFFVTGASVDDQPSMLWYQELLLVFLRAPAGSFTLSSDGVQIAGVLGEREQRRAVWWGAVQRLSQITAESRERFLRAAQSYFGLEETLKFFLATYPETWRHLCLLTRTELRQLSAGGMTIGAHTLTHPILAQLPPELAWVEIAGSGARLEAELGKKVWAFAYPFGDAGSVTPRVIAMAKEAGFEAAFLNTGGGLGTSLPPHAIPRVHVNAGMSLAELEAHVSGFYESLQRGVKRAPQTSAPGIGVVRTDPSKPATPTR